ncbi:MAG: FAD binding domain-containing protein [Carbonactinosporaceae bacterium]
MDFLQPRSWHDALAARAARPGALAIAGGTDVMVDLNFDRRRPSALLDLGHVPDLSDWAEWTEGAEGHPGGSWLRLGAGVTYARVVAELGDRLPGLAMASRTVGSPQIRNRGTLGGNLGSASPAGDAHPPLLASEALVEVASVRGARRVPVREFFTGPGQSDLAPDELISAVLVRPARGGQQFSKIGTRNAMVIAVCSFAVALDHEARTVRTGVGSAAPVPLAAREAERFCEAALDEQRLWSTRAALPDALARRFAELVAAATRPIDDVRGSAAYRRRALAVIARRALTWAWDDGREG